MDTDLLWAGCAVAAFILCGLFLGPMFWAGVALIGASTILLGFGMLAYQCLQAIHQGYWAAWEFREALAAIGFGNLSPNSVSVDSVVQWIMALPLSAGVIGTGLIITWIGMVGKTFAQERDRRRTLRR